MKKMLFLVWVLMVSQIYAAPAPLSKPIRGELVEALTREDFIGKWSITFPDAGTWLYTFHENGSFTSDYLNKYHYSGNWIFRNKIHINETTAPEGHLPNFYDLTFQQEGIKFNRYKLTGKIYYPKKDISNTIFLVHESKIK